MTITTNHTLQSPQIVQKSLTCLSQLFKKKKKNFIVKYYDLFQDFLVLSFQRNTYKCSAANRGYDWVGTL